MSWKRYGIFFLLLVCNIALNEGIDGLHGIGLGHAGQNIAFTFRLMDPIERTILIVLIILLLRKPIGQAIGSMFGGKGGSSGGTNGSTGAGAQASTQQPDQQ